MDELKQDLSSLFSAQLDNRISLAKTGARERKRKLKLLLATFLEMESEAEAALYTDMKKSATEAGVTEIMGIKTEASFAIKNLNRWMKTRRVGAPLTVSFTRGWIRPEPKGTVLIISPWNYPILLVLVDTMECLFFQKPNYLGSIDPPIE